ncbi:hypothetical protein E4631_10915 [Hymenobacter sp. UV11]|uniref:Imm32 family immunity protein n=1 Tax=Hymenobacter sp. UV11 TaxID=1849735 RepID=UPI00105DF6CD|nr:hypothetical protein [Hymenobacter sp. UV11]TDN40470.1 hypothetical protein A8B98_13640 [Hymenobacter sp. UV11]TFZ66520.1 hypothetical protein E4631_10915 [Hymenobacter sp. UV11]
MKPYQSEITGHLDFFTADNEDEFGGATEKWQTLLIHGDSEGLKSFARLLLRLAELKQDELPALPFGAREHVSLRPCLDISNSSVEVIVGRLDAKGTGAFYDRYISKSGSAKDNL